MSEKKNWHSTVLGWFVVKEGEDASPDESAGEEPEVAQDLAVGLRPNAAHRAGGGSTAPAAPSPVTFVKDVPASPGGQVDFDGVFAAADIDDDERGRVTKAKELLAALPAGTDPAVKKQIVEASLKAFGVPIEKIIEAGVQEIQALEGYIRLGANDTSKLIDESQQRIVAYEEDIRRIRTIMEERVAEQQGVMKACNDKKLEIQAVLEFFGRDAVAKVVRDSPKLIEPT